MSSRGLWVKLGRNSIRSTIILALASVLLIVAGATGLHRVVASLSTKKTNAAATSGSSAAHLRNVAMSDGALKGAKVVGIVEGNFDANSNKMTFLNSSNKNLKVTYNAFGRADVNSPLPAGTYTTTFVRSCANPGSANCPPNSSTGQVTAPSNTISGEMKITNNGSLKFYNTRLIFTDFLNVRGGTPVSANAYFNDGQIPANGKLGISRDYGDIDPSGGSQTRVWTFSFPTTSLTSFYFRYVIYADIGVATESVEPAAVQNDAARTVTITGQNFNSPTVELLNGSGTSVATLSVSSSSATSISAVVPAGTTPGIYSVRVTNSGGTAGGPGSSTLIGRLTVTTVPDGGHTGTFSSFSDAGPYRITGASTISGTVPAGTVVYVNDGITLQVGSGLNADGGIPGVPSTSPAQIVFTRVPGGSSWGGISAITATGDVTLKNCVIEFGGTSGNGQVDISGSSRTLKFTDSISRRSAGHGIKAIGTDDKFTGFTRSRIENNAGTAVLLSANAALGTGGGMADLDASNSNTSVPDQGYYYSAANVIRGNGVNAIQIDASANDFTKSGPLVGQGDIPIQILGSNANPSVVGNSTAPTGATLTINPGALIQLAAGLDLKAGDGTLFGNIAADGFAGISHSGSADTSIFQKITFDKIGGGGNFGSLFFSTKSAANSILNFVTVQNGGDSGLGSGEVIIDDISYTFKFTYSDAKNSSHYGLQYRSNNTVDRTGTTYSSNTSGNENVVSAAVTLATIAGGTYGDGNSGTKASLVKPIAVAVDAGRGIYFVDRVPDTPGSIIRFLNTSGTTQKIAGQTVPAGTVKNLSRGLFFGALTPGGGAGLDVLADQVDFLEIEGIALSADKKILYTGHSDNGTIYIRAYNVSPGADSGTSAVTISGTNTVRTGYMTTVYDDSSASKLKDIKGLAVNPVSGDIYIADIQKYGVFKLTTAGVLTLFAGTGTKPNLVGVSSGWLNFPLPAVGANPNATDIYIYEPQAIEVSADGSTVYIADGRFGRVVRVQSGIANLVTQLGEIDNVSGKYVSPIPAGITLFGGSLYIANSFGQTIVRIDNPGSVAANSTLGSNIPPINPVSGANATVCDYSGSACGDGGSNSAATFNFQNLYENLVSDSNGLVIADQAVTSRGRLRYMNLSGASVNMAGVTVAAGTTNTIAGTGLLSPFDTGLASSAVFENMPAGVAVDANNNLWITEASVTGGSSLRFVNRGASTITMFGQSVAPGAIIKVNKDVIDLSSDESTTPNNAYFYTLQGLTITSEGVYIVDSNGKSVPAARGKKTSKVRFINTSAAAVTFYSNPQASGTTITVNPGEIKTIAGGSDDPTHTGDSFFATQSVLLGATDVAIHPTTGDIYIAESANKKVRKISRSTGVVSSLSGIGSNVFTGLAFDSAGKLHIAVYDTNTVLRESASGSGIFSSISGSGSIIKGPRDIAVDSAGAVYVMNGYFVDAFNSSNQSRIIKVPLVGSPANFVGVDPGTPGFGGDGGSPTASTVKVDFGVDRIDIDVDASSVLNLEQITGITVTSSGEVIFADAKNYRVRRVK